MLSERINNKRYKYDLIFYLSNKVRIETNSNSILYVIEFRKTICLVDCISENVSAKFSSRIDEAL